ncbi:MAG: GFA family protein [Thermoleophilaceae bacterium]|nr:GFA family protein [Thermoleophilaceae bacterium]
MTGPAFTGGCLCGAVRFEVEELGPASYCHCTRCRRRTGAAASAQTRIDGSSLRLLAGEDRVRSYRPEQGFEKLFCAGCGSQLFSRNPAEPAQMSVRLGAFDDDPGVRPQWRQYVAYAAEWEPIPDDGLPRYDEGKPGGFAEAP